MDSPNAQRELPADARAQGVPSNWLAYIGSPDVDATAKQAERAGAKVLMPPTDIPTVGRFAIVQDPQGAVFGILQAFKS